MMSSESTAFGLHTPLTVPRPSYGRTEDVQIQKRIGQTATLIRGKRGAKTLFFKLLRSTDGQDLVEYAVLTSLISLVAVVAVGTLGTAIGGVFQVVADQLEQ